MVVVEILVGLMFALAIIMGIVKIGGPMAEGFALKLRSKYEQIGPEEQQILKKRMSALEEEIRQLKQHLSDLQATADFHGGVLESMGHSEPKKLEGPSERKGIEKKNKK